MSIRFTGLLCGTALLMSAPAAFAADPFNVSIRVEGKAKTLVKERTVTLADAPVIKDGNPDHACNGQAAIGALNAGTGGDWSGTWYEGLGYTADVIKSTNPAPAYFELWVNHKLSSTGLCDSALKAGDDVLMFVQDCEYVPALEGCKAPVTPLGVRVAKTIKRGTVRTVKIVDYAADGKATAERGATVFVNGKKLGKTNKAGQIKVKGTKTGTATIYATKAGHARSETDAVRIVK
jgi:predicted RNA-binding protein with TRAM domain